MDTRIVTQAVLLSEAMPSTVDAYKLGWHHYHAGKYAPPRGYTEGFAEYLKGYNNAWAEDKGRTILR